MINGILENRPDISKIVRVTDNEKTIVYGSKERHGDKSYTPFQHISLCWQEGEC